MQAFLPDSRHSFIRRHASWLMLGDALSPSRLRFARRPRQFTCRAPSWAEDPRGSPCNYAFLSASQIPRDDCGSASTTWTMGPLVCGERP